MSKACLLASVAVAIASAASPVPVYAEGSIYPTLAAKIEAMNGIDPVPSQPLATNLTFGTVFPCTEDVLPSSEVPTSAHKLRPADVQVVAALGDSVTAGFGELSDNIINLLTESRGLSWTIGGQEDLKEMVTIPAVLKQFNKGIKGFSTGDGGPNSNNASLNMAISGAIASGMNNQAKTLINKMKADDTIDFDFDWKVVSIWIGGNDLCAVCNSPAKHSAEVYAGHIRDTLQTLYDGMPRVFVNMIQILDITQLSSIDTKRCSAFPGNIRNTVCPCGTSDDPAVKAQVVQASIDYQKLTEEVVNDPKWTAGREDFAAVIQPFFLETVVPKLPDGVTFDDSYFGADCFHFSQKAHQAAAVALWNNMIEPVGAKTLAWTVGEGLKCPTTASPYFATSLNA